MQQPLDRVTYLLDALADEPNIKEQQKQEIALYLTQIKKAIQEGNTPDKAQFDGLIKAVGAHESIIEPILGLSQHFGYLPSL
jgi:molecular chaperone DnaK (HSP70)